MTFHHRIAVTNNKSAKQTAKLVNERRSQALKWLARQSDQKKQSEPIKK